ncbi:hypothetical protein BGX26_004801 [Mortierella sp. AD094]|nr:hypothetical protein BGX26_004801 [Mortierella sp. AD094]
MESEAWIRASLNRRTTVTEILDFSVRNARYQWSIYLDFVMGLQERPRFEAFILKSKLKLDVLGKLPLHKASVTPEDAPTLDCKPLILRTSVGDNHNLDTSVNDGNARRGINDRNMKVGYEDGQGIYNAFV